MQARCGGEGSPFVPSHDSFTPGKAGDASVPSHPVTFPEKAGDASVPTPHPPNPRPYNCGTLQEAVCVVILRCTQNLSGPREILSAAKNDRVTDDRKRF